MASGTTEDLRNETDVGESGVLGGGSAERPMLYFRWSRGSDPWLLRLTMNGLLDRTVGERPHASRLVIVPRLDLPGIMRASRSQGAFSGELRQPRCR